MKRWIWIAAALIFGAVPAAAWAMDAQSFYTQSLTLKKKGAAAALISPEFKPLIAEMRRAGQTVRAENDKAKLAGMPLFCPPAQRRMTPDELLSELGRIPKARRAKISVTQAFREILIRKYPCG